MGMKADPPGGPQMVVASLREIIRVDDQIERTRRKQGRDACRSELYDNEVAWLTASRSNLFDQVIRYAGGKQPGDQDVPTVAAQDRDAIQGRISEARQDLAGRNGRDAIDGIVDKLAHDVEAILKQPYVLRLARELSKGGKLDRSAAKKLIQAPHTPDELQKVIQEFWERITPDARGKLMLEALAPMPEGVENQRDYAFFDDYPLKGTHTTQSGTLVTKQVQIYNGRTMILMGEAGNLDKVSEALHGSGYKPLTTTSPDGRPKAIVQVWANNFIDASIKPYNAFFMIVAAVPENTPDDESTIAAHENGMTSVLSMLNGTYRNGKFKNAPLLFFFRLFESTTTAVEFGRELLGTDKRDGSISVTPGDAGHVTLSVKDQAGKLVVRGTGEVGSDSQRNEATMQAIEQAADRAGIKLPPAGIRYVYPAVARIGQQPVVYWEWHTESALQIGPIKALTFGTESEEARILKAEWGFTPNVAAYIPNVRGVLTNLSKRVPSNVNEQDVELDAFEDSELKALNDRIAAVLRRRRKAAND